MTEQKPFWESPEWQEYEAPYYLEKEYVVAMAELLSTTDPDEAEKMLEECWIGTFSNDVELAEHIASEANAEYDLEKLLTDNPIGVPKYYVKIDYEQFARDLLMGDVEVLYNLDGIYQTYIWSRY